MFRGVDWIATPQVLVIFGTLDNQTIYTSESFLSSPSNVASRSFLRGISRGTGFAAPRVLVLLAAIPNEKRKEMLRWRTDSIFGKS